MDEPGDLVILIQEQINVVIGWMEQGTSQDRLYARLLRLAYIQNIGSHEIVAERLKLSQATYYLHLKKAVARLSNVLFIYGIAAR